jgi:hypothetical protein
LPDDCPLLCPRGLLMGIDDLLVEARAALLGQQRPDTCPACQGSLVAGALHHPVAHEDEIRRIERCDTCGIFGSDLEAALAVASRVGRGARAYYLRVPGAGGRERSHDPWVQRGTPAPPPEGLELAVVTAEVVPDPDAARKGTGAGSAG